MEEIEIMKSLVDIIDKMQIHIDELEVRVKALERAEQKKEDDYR